MTIRSFFNSPSAYFTAIALCLIPALGLSDFHSRGEPREALVVQSMLQSGNFILPAVYNDALPSKPPLFHWLGALFSCLAKETNEFTVRLPSALFSLAALGFFVSRLSWELSSRGIILFMIILSFSFEWLRSGVSARVDMVHAASLACGLLSGFQATVYARASDWFYTIIFLGLAMLSKGPVGIIIPVLIFSPWVIFGPQTSRRGLLLARFLLVLLCSFLIGLSWYIPAYFQAPAEFARKFWYENISRMTGTMGDIPHNHSAFFLIGMLFAGTLPWSPFAVFFALRQLFVSFKSFRVRWTPGSPLEKFSILSVIVIVLFYSIPASKRGVYLLPAYPFLGILASILFERKLKNRQADINRAFILLVSLTLVSQTVIRPFIIAPRSSERAVAGALNLLPAGTRVYSYAFEFYGASFYSKRRFLRLEDRIGTLRPEQDVIVVKKEDLTRLNSFLKNAKFEAGTCSEVSLNGNIVSILKTARR